MSEPLRRPHAYRLASSIGSVLALLGSCLHYALREPPATPDVTSVIAYLENVGPFWPMAFGIATAAVAASLITRRALNVAHLVAAGVLSAYAFALFYTATSTGSGWITACMTTGLCVHTIALAASYTRETPGWTRH